VLDSIESQIFQILKSLCQIYDPLFDTVVFWGLLKTVFPMKLLWNLFSSTSAHLVYYFSWQTGKFAAAGESFCSDCPAGKYGNSTGASVARITYQILLLVVITTLTAYLRLGCKTKSPAQAPVKIFSQVQQAMELAVAGNPAGFSQSS